MLFIFFALFVGMPLLELFLLLRVGSELGALNTIAIVLFTGALGAYLAKSQGRAVWLKSQEELKKGGVPAESLLHGLLIFIGGLLLITPGFVTDAIGFSLVFAPTRNLAVRWIRAHLAKAVASGRYKVYTSGAQGFPGGAGFRVYTYSAHSQRSSDTFQSGGRPIRDVNPEVLEGEAGRSRPPDS